MSGVSKQIPLCCEGDVTHLSYIAGPLLWETH